MQIEPMTPQTLTQQVFGALRRYIISNGLGPGDRLPPETKLAEVLGVGRGTVRDALKSLQVVGGLSRKPSQGTVLQPINLSILSEVSQFLMLRTAGDWSELVAARQMLEAHMLDMVAANATEQDYDRMETANRLIEADIESGGLGVEGDMLFHQALVSASANKFVIQFAGLLREFFRDRRLRVLPDKKALLSGVTQHRRIVDSIREGDIKSAQQVMAEHLSVYSQIE